VTEQSTELKTEVIRPRVTIRMIEEASKGVLNFQYELGKAGVWAARGIAMFMDGAELDEKRYAPQRDDSEGTGQLPLLL